MEWMEILVNIRYRKSWAFLNICLLHCILFIVNFLNKVNAKEREKLYYIFNDMILSLPRVSFGSVRSKKINKKKRRKLVTNGNYFQRVNSICIFLTISCNFNNFPRFFSRCLYLKLNLNPNLNLNLT